MGNVDIGVGMEGPVRVPAAQIAAQISATVALADAVMAIVTRTLSTPPGSPAVEDRYIVGAAATDAWAGKEKQIATWSGAAWTFIVPTAKSTVKVLDESAFYTWSVADSDWVIMLGDALAFATWAALSAVTGTRQGQKAEVNGDVGTHTDPVVGGTVSNSGLFAWSTSPAGWQRMADSTYAPLVSPALTGNPTSTTPAAGDNDTSIATTAFVQTEIIASIDKANLAAMPADPYGVYPMDRAATAPNPFIPNITLATASASLQLNRVPTRAFNSQFYTRTSCTAADRTLVGPDALTDSCALASTAGAWLLRLPTSASFPAGQYTLVAHVARNTGTDQPFAFTVNGGTTRTVVTATAAFQRLTATFTLAATTAGNLIAICSSDGLTGALLNLHSFEIYAGAADLGASLAGDTHLYLGLGINSMFAPSSGVRSQSYGVIRFPSNKPMTKWTVSALVKVTASGTNAILSDIEGQTNFLLSTGTTSRNFVDIKGLNFPNKISPEGGVSQRPTLSGGLGLFDLVGDGWHVLTVTYDGVAEEVWLDDVRLLREEVTRTALNLRQLAFQFPSNIVNAKHDNAGYLCIYDRALSAAEIRQLVWVQRVKGADIAAVSYRDKRYILVEGDSNHGVNSYSWPWQLVPKLTSAAYGSVWAVSGSTLADLASLGALTRRAPYVDAVIPSSPFERKFILTVAIGTNDAGDTVAYPSEADYITALRAYCMARAAAGFTVVLCTMPPISGGTLFNSRRAIINADIIANPSLYGATAIVDLGGDPIIGPDNSYTVNPTYWTDTKHFSQLGSGYVAQLMADVINPLLVA